MPRNSHLGELQGLTIAWAMDNRTGRPIHVLELGVERSGRLADCSCPSCQSALVAVNNAKQSYVRRPHFRHVAGAGAEGTGLTGCAIVSARVAVLRALELQGWIDLPARERNGTVKGLLGQAHTATAVRQAERVQLAGARFVDRTRALLTLDDGRVIEVSLASTPDAQEKDEVGAIITIEVTDPTLATLDAEQLRGSLTLPGLVCWRRHWEDDSLVAQAEEAAFGEARELLSVAPPELVLPDDMPPELKSETVLHYAVKQILGEGGAFVAPGASLVSHAYSGDHVHERVWGLDPRWLLLNDVQLERRLGLTRPDLLCAAVNTDGSPAFSELCIEVTVTNAIHEERLDRIRRVGMATIEVDLRSLAGRITRTELRELVVRGEHLKSWAFHPDFEAIQARLDSEVVADKRMFDEGIALQRERAARIASTPLEVVVNEYLAAIIPYLAFKRDNRGPFLPTNARRVHYEQVKEPVIRAAEALRQKGIAGADSEVFIDGLGLLAEILTIKTNQVLVSDIPQGPAFALLKERFASPLGVRGANVPVLLGAALIYGLPMGDSEREQFQQWREEARQIYRASAKAYSRVEKFDSLLSALLPEIGNLLLRTSSQHRSRQARYGSPSGSATRSSTPRMPSYASGFPKLLDTGPHEFMLRGRDLENWIRENPLAAEQLGYTLGRRTPKDR